jgi:transposase-like protein
MFSGFIAAPATVTFASGPRKFSREVKALAIDMHLNNVGIRKIARFTGAAPATVIAWIRKAHKAMTTSRTPLLHEDAAPDVIEMDEIYTFVQKNGSGPSSGQPIVVGRAASSPIISPTPA